MSANGSKMRKAKLKIRNARYQDIPDLVKLSQTVYGQHAMTEQMLRGQISAFPEGQFVAEYEGRVVGHCATFVIKGDIALKQHTWKEITGNGFASRHDPAGDYLYGMEICVDQSCRGMRIGQRLYDARKLLCLELSLKGIVFGGRMPGFVNKKKKLTSPKEYLQQVQDKKIRDQVISFQLSNDFEIIGVLEDYLPSDKESEGFASHMLWHNPRIPHATSKHDKQRGRIPDSIRIATVQFQVRKVSSIDQFEGHLEYFVDIAADYRADFVLFPELLTIPLLSIESAPLPPEKGVEKITEYTERYVSFMRTLAISYNINIIGGSHFTKQRNGDIQNVSYVFLRDGSVHTQPKLHPTPNEKYWWNIKGGNRLEAIATDCGPIGVTICYDAEFPETARHLVDQGALILFVPFCTDERQSYMRVRYCAQARAVENQVYVAMSGLVGNLPDVENMDIHYAESCILTPCDFPFARDGIAATTSSNTEMIVFADLRMENLILSRNSGTVLNLKDRRFDLYRVEWEKQKESKVE